MPIAAGIVGVDDAEPAPHPPPTPRIDPTRDPVHVVARMLQREISWSDILAVVAKPTKTTAGHSGRMNYFGYAEGRRRIRVTLDADGAVVTVAKAQTRQE
jgi:hypothetical protein